MKRFCTILNRQNDFRVFLSLLFIYLFSNCFIALASDEIIPENYWSAITSHQTSEAKLIKINKNNEIFVSIWGDGVYYCNGKNETFTQVMVGLDDKYIQAIEFDSSGNIYAATLASGVYKSTNKGTYWTSMNDGLTNLNVKSLVITKDADIFAGTYGSGVFRLLKDSSNWEPVNQSFWYWDVNCLTVSYNNYLIAGTNGDGVYRSSDKGVTWISGNAGITAKTINSFSHGPLKEIFMFTNGNGAVSSISDGAEWAYISKDSLPINFTSGLINPDGELMGASADSGAWWYDKDMLACWRKGDGFKGGAYSMAINSNGVIYAATADSGICKSTNYGRNWIKTNFFATNAIQKIFTKNNYVFHICKNNSAFRSTNNGNSWEQMNCNDRKFQCMSMDSSNNLYVGTNNGIYKSNDLGVSWSFFGLADSSISAILATNNGVYASSNHFFRTTNNGNTWTEIDAIYTVDGHGKIVRNIGFTTINIQPDGTLWAGSSNWYGLWTSTDNGDTWSVAFDFMACYNYDFIGNNTILAATSRGLCYSTNDGVAWTRQTFGLENPKVNDVYVGYNNYIYFSIDNNVGFFRMKSIGSKWDTLNTGLVMNSINSIAGNGDGYLFAASNILYRTVIEERMIVPNTVFPIHERMGITRTPTLIWNSVPKADLYEMEFSIRQDFSSYIEKIVFDDTSRALVYELDYNTLYFWRVRSKTNSNYSAWTTPRAFRTIFKAPILVSPKNEKKGFESSATVVWKSVEGANRYKLEVSNSPDFSSIFYEKDDLIDTFDVVNNLALNTKYYWRVFAKNEYAVGESSEIRWFKSKLFAPTLKYPTNGSWGIPTDVTMLWNLSPDAVKYAIQIASDPDFINVIFYGITTSNNGHNEKNLQKFTTYYWRMQALEDDDSPSDWSETWSYTTNIDPTVLRLPENNAVNQTTKINFSWDAFSSPALYYIQIASDADFANIIVEDSTLTDNKYTSEFDNYTEYYWRVRIKSENKYISPWSVTWKFQTCITSPVLLSPANNAIDVYTHLIMEWNQVNGGQYYRIQLSTDSEFNNIIRDYDSLTLLRKEITNLEYLTDYWWRVKSYNQDNPGEWSQVWKFKTKEFSSVFNINSNDIQPLVFPNPIVKNAKITFELNQDAFVSISVVNQLGIVVDEIAKEQFMQKGIIEKTWYPNNLSKGVYYIHVNSTNDMIIIKAIYQR